MEDEMSKTGMGSLSEVYDGGETAADSPPQNPGGCIAQAWSVAEILRVWMDLEGSRRKK